MTDRNPYSPYKYDTFDQPLEDAEESGFFARMASRITNPVFAIVALLLTAGAFMGIILGSYPESDLPSEAAPIVRADNAQIKIMPDNTIQVQANAPESIDESSVYGSVQSQDLREKPPVENLLDQEKPMDKLEVFARQAEATYGDSASDDSASGVRPQEITEGVEPPEQRESTSAQVEAPKVKEEGDSLSETISGLSAPPAPGDDIAFVKSVLEEKDAKGGNPPASSKIEKIEPAAGAASPAVKSPAVPGRYYIQLGSVGSEPAATGEWRKLQRLFPSTLGAASFRVQSAEVAGKGTMYRIQAGPMGRDDAMNLCAAIKVERPGGCIVVQ